MSHFIFTSEQYLLVLYENKQKKTQKNPKKLKLREAAYYAVYIASEQFLMTFVFENTQW